MGLGIHAHRKFPTYTSSQLPEQEAMPTSLWELSATLPETRARQTSWLEGGLWLHAGGAWGRETGHRRAPAPRRAAADASTSWRPALGISQKRAFQHTLRIFSVFLFHT